MSQYFITSTLASHMNKPVFYYKYISFPYESASILLQVHLLPIRISQYFITSTLASHMNQPVFYYKYISFPYESASILLLVH